MEIERKKIVEVTIAKGNRKPLSQRYTRGVYIYSIFLGGYLHQHKGMVI